MKKLIVLFLSILIVSCTYRPGDRETQIIDPEVTDSIVLIKLPNGVSFHWDNKKQEISIDKLYNSLLLTFPAKLQSTVEQISNTNKPASPVKVCGCKRNLVLGDLAFLLLVEIKKLPVVDIYQMQWDCLDKDCKYPLGYIDYIKDHRFLVKRKLEIYLKPEDNKNRK